jgi:hypothetical protein
MNNLGVSNKQKYFQAFNNHLSLFIKDLMLAFPDDKDFALCKNSLNLLVINNEQKPCKLFHTFISDYKDNILNKNEDFFLNNDYSEIMSEDVTSSLINKLKNYWTLLENDKDKVWNYLILLIKLSDRCYS